MRLSSGVRQFWLVIGFNLISAVGFTAVIAYFLNWRYAVLVGVSTAWFAVWREVCSIKQRMVRSLPDQLDFQPVNFKDFDFQLNVNTLEQQTKDLEALGFVRLQDYALQPSQGLARCFAHPAHYCFAEVGQIIDAAGKTAIANPAIFSYLSDDWALSHVQGEPSLGSGIALLWRNPKGVGIYHPDTNLKDLLDIHLRFRQKMIQDLGITVLTDGSWEAYGAGQQKAARDRKTALRQRNLLVGMIKVTLFELNPTLEWLGAYAKPGKRSV
ncbi:hypothetical protein H6G89_16035 [Oscillatoria sp. FACHB-1407]|uniref:hypothetical protein n=1 Tax=Oscillatoria sp. FACHB-1407 TaxID=2692847 RepID=UPI0016861970|nr:hypothetical protein [Oscillatoria sp. FACHB-1407]MBD2462555.1 hypothetical protein [Oscillatoria sp. FACHB-1407]